MSSVGKRERRTSLNDVLANNKMWQLHLYEAKAQLWSGAIEEIDCKKYNIQVSEIKF